MKSIEILDEKREAPIYKLSVVDKDYKALLESGTVYIEDVANVEVRTFNHIGVSLATIVDCLASANPKDFDNKVYISIAKDTRDRLILFLGELLKGRVSYDGFIRRALRAASKGAVKASFDKELIDLNRPRVGRPNCVCKNDRISGPLYNLACPLHGDWFKRLREANKHLEAFLKAGK